MKKNNRRAGLRLEREVVKRIATSLGLTPFNGKNVDQADVGTTRAFSRSDDASKIDVWFKDEPYKQLKIQIKAQLCRTSSPKINVDPLHEIQGEGVKALIAKLSKNGKKREVPIGYYVTLTLDDFLSLLKQVSTNESDKTSKRSP